MADHARRRLMVQDAGVISLAFLILLILGGGGAYLCAKLATPEGPHLMATLPVLYWGRWIAKVAGAMCGQLICGFVVGRYLNRVRPVHFLIGVLTYAVGVILLNRGFLDADDGLYLDAVGHIGAATQTLLQISAMLAVVSLGVRLGRKRRVIASKTSEIAANFA